MLAAHLHSMRRALLSCSAFALALLASVASTAVAIDAPPSRLSAITGVDQAEFSADGAQVVVSTRNGTISLWNAANGSPIQGEITGAAQAFMMSADSKLVLVSHPEGGARIFDSASGAARSPQLDVHLRIPAHPEAVFAPNGQQLLIFEPGAAAIFAIATGQRVATLSLRAKPGPAPAKNTKAPDAAAAEEEEEDLDLAPAAHFTRDGARCFLMSAQGVVTAYDTATWKPLGAPMRHPAAPSAYSFGMALSEDGGWIATFDEPGENGPQSHLQIWDATKGKRVGKPMVATNGIAGEFVQGTSSPRLLVTPGRGEASIRELPSYKKVAAIPAHDDVDGPAVALSPDGKWALSWGADRIVRLQATATGAVQESHAFQATISQVLMLPDSTGCLVVFDNSAFLLQNYYDHYVLKLSFPNLNVSQSVRLTEYLHRAVLSLDGKRFLLKSGATEKERVTVYDVNDFKALAD